MFRSIVTRVLITGLLICCAGNCPAQSQSPFNVKNYGAAGDGIHLDTDAINKTIQAAHEVGGGTVIVPAGKYVSGTIRLQSNITLWLDAGATILGCTNLSDYHWPEGQREWYAAIILADDAQNVAIEGRGTIDGQNLGNPNGEEHIRGPHAILIYRCKDVLVRDITVKDSGNYSLILRSCERVNIDGFTACAGYDGINMHDVKDATISNCRLYTGDDSLAGAYWENVTVCNCVLNSSCNAIRTGGRNVLINNCLIYGPGRYIHRLGFRRNTESGFQILPQTEWRGEPKSQRVVASGPIDNMILSDITMINVRSPVYIAFDSNAPYSGHGSGVGRIIIQNLTVINCGRTPFYVAAPPNNPAESIIVRDARLSFVGGVDEKESNGQGFSPYSMMDAYGAFCRNVENLEFHDVRMNYADPDGRPAIFGDNIGTLDLDRFVAEREPDGAPSLMFSSVGKLVINGAEAAPADSHVKALEVPAGGVIAGEPFIASATVQNTGHAGLGELDLQLGNEMVKRSVWLDSNETTRVRFVDLQSQKTGEIRLRVGNLAKAVNVQPKPTVHPVSAPYHSFQNLNGQVEQIEGGFYIKEGGEYVDLEHGDQYGAAYLQKGLGETNSVIVKLENPDGTSSWLGRVGIMVRKDITKPGESPDYLILAASPSNGYSLEWDSNGDGRIDSRTVLDGYTYWPAWLKLQRKGSRFVGFSSKDGNHWTKVGETDVPDANGPLDVGVFAHRSSARFLDFKIQ